MSEGCIKASMMSLTLTLIALVFFLLWFAYKKLTAKFGIFEERGVGFNKPVPLFGNMFSAVMGRRSMFEIFEEQYQKFYNDK